MADLELGKMTGLLLRTAAALGDDGADTDLEPGVAANTPGIAEGTSTMEPPSLRELPDFALEGGQVVHLDLQVVDDALDAWAPLVEHLGCGLERVEAGQRRSRSGVDLMLDVVEAFVDLLKKQS
jgi:hypothetical protein